MGIKQKISRKIGTILYFHFAIHLPTYYSYKNRFFGKTARKLRARYARKMCEYVGNNVNIQKGALISSGLKIGNNSGVGKNSDVQGDITIGNDVMMGPECVFYTTGHNFSRTDVTISSQGMTPSKPIVIEDDVWLGRRVIILPGVHIGKGSVIGAGAVVTKDIPEYVMAAGNPAVVKKYRKPEEGYTLRIE